MSATCQPLRWKVASPVVCWMMYWRRRFLMSLALLAALAFAGPVLADSTEQDAIRQAVESGAIRPLADILSAVRGRLPGDIIGIEIDRKKDRWLYEFRVLDRSGRLFEVYVDAGSGEIEQVKEK